MEIERKHKLPDNDFSALKARLAELGFCEEKKKHQVDAYYLRAGQSDEDTHFKIGDEAGYLRLRHDVAASAFSFDLKLVNEQNRSGIFGEYECSLNDKKSFDNCDEILKLIGFRRACVVDKMREGWRRGEFEIALDAVEGLGKFVEIEIIADEAEAKAALARVDAFAAELGLGTHTRILTGYVDLFAWKRIGKKF